ncbi:hypothetical protein [Kitasatospora sp. HPMI-4]|uniref:hypothetical protein n=1 Tax=Kitasatospora sp. HPMI-4 TaxID=3448443 RepID=UPI003F1B94CA
MAGDSVWIDLDEVEAAAKSIRGMLEELTGPANHLEAVAKQVKATVYGTDLLGKALQGGSSSVGGLAEHQEQVLAGIRTFLQNSEAMAQNLLTMCQSHRANDELHAADLNRVHPGSAAPPAGPIAPVSGAAEPSRMPSEPATPPVSAPAPAAETSYHNPQAPTLDYDKPAPKPEPGPRGGGGRQPSLI